MREETKYKCYELKGSDPEYLTDSAGREINASIVLSIIPVSLPKTIAR